MDDKHPEAITVQLGGKARRIKLGSAALRLARRAGQRITKAELTSPEPDTLAQLVWVGLLPDEPDLDEVKVMQWMADLDDEGPVLAKVAEALSAWGDGLEKAFGDLGNARRGKRK